jgi:hypothetical protein
LNPRSLSEDLKSIQTNLRWNLHGIVLEENSIGSNPKNETNRKVHGLKNQYSFFTFEI